MTSVAAWFLLAIHGFATAVCGQPVETSIDGMIRGLDDSLFENRMQATRQLIAAGGPAIDPVADALNEAQPSLELQTRGLKILEQIARSDDQAARLRAEQALRTLAAKREGGLALRAAGSLSDLNYYQCQVAIKTLREAGAEVETAPIAIGRGFSIALLRLEIGRDWKGNADLFEEVQRFDQVNRIVLDHPDVDNRYLAALADFAFIQTIEIKRAKIDDAGVAELVGVDRIINVAVYHSPISDASINALGEIKAHNYALYGTRITAAGKEELIERAPASQVDIRRGGFLGIGGDNRAQIDSDEESKTVGFLVERVEPDSAADDAGIEIADIILSYDGKPVHSFFEIKDMIAENAVGETVDVELRRGDKEMKLKVTLKEWP